MYIKGYGSGTTEEKLRIVADCISSLIKSVSILSGRLDALLRLISKMDGGKEAMVDQIKEDLKFTKKPNGES